MLLKSWFKCDKIQFTITIFISTGEYMYVDLGGCCAQTHIFESYSTPMKSLSQLELIEQHVSFANSHFLDGKNPKWFWPCVPCFELFSHSPPRREITLRFTRKQMIFYITFNNNMRLSLMGIHCMLFSWSSQLAKKTSKAIFEPAVEFFFLISFYIKLSYTRANCCFMIVLRFCFQTTKIALGSKTSRDRRRLKA